MRKSLLLLGMVLAGGAQAQTYSGYQTIQGTQVYTEIYESEGYARFSNECGSQTLTQTELQRGAIPDDIIPCPREDSGGGGGQSCEPGHVLSAGGGCRPIGSDDCGNGSYCESGSICTAEGNCLEIMSSRVCTDLRQHCPEGYSCDSDNQCVEDDAGTLTEETVPDDPGRYAALVSTGTGRFFGVGTAATQAEAMAQARDTCETFKANTATAPEERAEVCRHSVWIRNGCVALSRSHDMFYGPSEKFAGGMASDPDMATASAESMTYCKAKGGQSCFTVPESVHCSDEAME